MIDSEYTVNLSREDYERLLLCLGYAVGAAIERGQSELSNSFLDLSNRINRNNPQWIPYRIEKT